MSEEPPPTKYVVQIVVPEKPPPTPKQFVQDLNGVLTPALLPSRVIEPFSCIISVFRPASISWSIEDLFLDVIAKTFSNIRLGAGLRAIPFAQATAVPSSITLEAISRS